jgi:type IV secretion system protein VirB2
MIVSPNNIGFSRERVRRILPFATVLAVILLLPVAARAASPWETAVQTLATSISGPIARGLGLVAIVIGGLTWAFTEGGDSKRMLAGIFFGVGMAVAASNFMLWIFGISN